MIYWTCALIESQRKICVGLPPHLHAYVTFAVAGEVFGHLGLLCSIMPLTSLTNLTSSLELSAIPDLLSTDDAVANTTFTFLVKKDCTSN